MSDHAMRQRAAEIENETAKLTGYRWVMLFLCCPICLCIGSIYAWSVMSVPMAEELRVPALATPFQIATSIGVITMIIGGILNDKFGPRWVMFSGGVLFGLGMFLSGMAKSVGEITLYYGVILGLGSTLVYGCAINNTLKFFPDHRGMVGGMTTAFYGISSVIMSPFVTFLNDRMGIRPTFRFLGILFLVVLCLGSMFMKRCPQGFLPDGYKPSLRVSPSGGKTPFEMIRQPLFYLMLLLLACGSFYGMMVISSARSIIENITHTGASTAALLVSVLCLFNTAGRLIAGTLSDRIGRINTLFIALFIGIIGLLLMIGAERLGTLFVLTVGIIFIGISFGTFLAVYPGFCADRFGTRYNTVNYGILWLGYSIAGLAGPAILTRIFAADGRYEKAFIVSLFIAAAGVVLNVICKKMIQIKEAAS